MKSDQLDTAASLRKFGFTMGIVVVLLFGLCMPWLFSHAVPLWPWVVAGLFWVVALVWPMALRPVAAAWLKLGAILAWVNTRILLGMMYFTVFLVIGLILRLLGKDPIPKAFDPTAESYRTKSRLRKAEHMEKPF